MSKILSFERPLVMGVVNLTPDSFYSGSRSLDPNLVLEKVSYMVENQVDILDLGAMSSRPGAKIISVDDELDRIKPCFNLIRKVHPDLFISIDTVHGAVAKYCLENGADMVNDISAGSVDETLIEVVAKYSAYYCLMHMQNMPENMQNNPKYSDVTLEVLSTLKIKSIELRNKGLNKILIDPGFGFGKTITDNYRLLNDLEVLKILDLPIMVGISRKSMIYKALKINPEESLSATTALHLLALQKGANILRVHDVLEAKQAVNLLQLLND